MTDASQDSRLDLQDRSSARGVLLFLLDSAIGQQPGVFVDGITSAAFVDLLHIVPKFEDLGQVESFTVDQYGFDESKPQFRVHLYAPANDVEVWVTMEKVKGAWKISAIKVPGIRD